MSATHHRGRVEIDLGHFAPHPRNVRRSLGDLKDLTRSIRDRQSRPRWSSCQADTTECITSSPATGVEPLPKRPACSHRLEKHRIELLDLQR